MSKISELVEEWRAMGPAQWGENAYGWLLDDGRPIRLAAWQRVVLDAYWQRRDRVSTLFISTTKKTGKTLLNSLITCWRWLTAGPPRLHFTVGNDRDQSAELQINMIAQMCQRHPILSHYVRVTRNELEFEPTGARLVALPMDWAGSSGGNFGTVSLTEIWAYVYEAGRRLFEELTPIPHIDCLRIIDSYAGYELESELLQQVWDRGLSGDRVSDEWPIYLTGQQLSYIHQGEDAQRRCWRGTEAARVAYYQEQRATLRESSFRRLHLNQWASSEDVFVTGEQWDACVLPDYRCPPPSRDVALTVGVDLGVRHDYAAVVTVWPYEQFLYLGPFRVWRPTATEDVDLDAVEQYLADLHRAYRIVVFGDPFQGALMYQRLARSGVAVHEYPQTTANLTRCGNALFDAVRQRRLCVYPGSDELRSHILAARGKESSRGTRLIKGTGKIDAAIALAMAVAESQEPEKPPSTWAATVRLDYDSMVMDVRDLSQPEPERAGGQYLPTGSTGLKLRNPFDWR